MATRNKFNTARVAALGVCKNFFRFEIQKPHAHRAVSQNSFQVTAPAAPAKILLRVQRHHRMSALPCAFTPGIPPESNSVAKCPHPIELVQHAARGGERRAVASASLQTRTATRAPFAASALSTAPRRLNPLICCRFGDSSTTPSRIIPGKPTPTASNELFLATELTRSAIFIAI